MNKRPECAIAIMAKAPWPGEVKTRLCPLLSHEEAAQLYRCFLLDKIEQLNSLKAIAPAVAYTPDDARPLFENLVSSGFTLIPQKGPDLGARLSNTLNQLLELGYPQVMAIDSDTPTLPLAYLERAFSLLSEPEIDVVLGPSEDGGYYLIGLRRLHSDLFEKMRWSTAHVFSVTMRRAQAKGLKVACLPTWYDVDTPEDLKRLRESLHSYSGHEAEHTKQFLMEWQK
ncbi:MAG TPA: TIGR04282 family arsenosugar biosynthesis glycosyltransferase [Candidatus Binatia bacterium]|nr:TIGR04282 family arsenosugar biosynthesis glycosyltransferase [Candidatus Binatia bacterium]